MCFLNHMVIVRFMKLNYGKWTQGRRVAATRGPWGRCKEDHRKILRDCKVTTRPTCGIQQTIPPLHGCHMIDVRWLCDLLNIALRPRSLLTTTVIFSRHQRWGKNVFTPMPLQGHRGTTLPCYLRSGRGGDGLGVGVGVWFLQQKCH